MSWCIVVSFTVVVFYYVVCALLQHICTVETNSRMILCWSMMVELFYVMMMMMMRTGRRYSRVAVIVVNCSLSFVINTCIRISLFTVVYTHMWFNNEVNKIKWWR